MCKRERSLSLALNSYDSLEELLSLSREGLYLNRHLHPHPISTLSLSLSLPTSLSLLDIRLVRSLFLAFLVTLA